jgi:hypothetical protein
MDLIKSFAGQVLVIPTHEANIQILRPNTTISVMANLIPNVLKHVLENQGVSQAIKIAGMKIRQPDERISELQKIMTNYPSTAAMKLLLSHHYRHPCQSLFAAKDKQDYAYTNQRRLNFLEKYFA